MSLAAEPKTIFRPARPEDAKVLGDICYSAFATLNEKHSFPPDFPSPEVAHGLMDMITVAPFVYSQVAEQDGRPIASNFLWEMGEIGGVGPITVDPTIQNSGIGRALMEDIIRRSDEVGHKGLRLCQAAFHCRSMSLYAKLGFDVKEPLACMNGTPLNRQTPGYNTRLATMDDLEACNDLCNRIHGHTRTGELIGAIERGSATVTEKGGTLAGYATEIGFFGHSVAEDNEAMKALIAFAPAFTGPGFLLPTRNTDLFRWALAEGIRMVQPITLMARGWYQEPKGAFLCSILF